MRDSAPTTFHMIGNAHTDPVWMWRWSEGVEAFISTCRSALQLMEEYDEWVFSCSSALLYYWLEKYEPELFEEVRRRIEEGRWEIVGGWWTEADCNIPSGEGLVRQALIGQSYFRSRFGTHATVGFSPDAFGHSAGLPQILRRSGLSSYIFCRPDPTELILDGPLFRWAATDDSRVVAYRVPFHYNMYETSVRKKVADVLYAMSNRTELSTESGGLSEMGSEWALFFGVGNHGGGPTREHLEQIANLGSDENDVSVSFSRLDTYIEAVADQIQAAPVRYGELQMNSPGTYSLNSAIKSSNRAAEFQLIRSEMLLSLADLIAGEGNDSRHSWTALKDAWTDVCFNHFHDILCGVAIGSAMVDAMRLYGRALSVADEVATRAYRRLARGIDVSDSPESLLVINPSSFDRNELIHFELWHDIEKSKWDDPVDLAVRDDKDNEIPTQQIQSEGKIGKDRIGVRFVGSVPAFGWNRWKVVYGQKGRAAAPAGRIGASSHSFGNERLFVEFDSDSGSLIKMCDRGESPNILDRPGIHFAVLRDTSDSWGHGVTSFDDLVGVCAGSPPELVESGDIFATMRTRATWGRSEIVQEYTLSADADYVDVRCRVFWGEPGTALVLRIPTLLSDSRLAVQAKYDSISHPGDGQERPAGVWKAITGSAGGDNIGLGVSDTLVHAASLHGGLLQLTILRCVPFATHEPHRMSADEDVRYVDMREMEFSYRLRLIEDDEFRSLLERDSLALNMPMVQSMQSRRELSDGHVGSGDATGTTIPEGVVVSALKRSENNNGWIVRLFDASGVGASGTVLLPALGFSRKMVFQPHEVVTLLIDNAGNGRHVLLTENEPVD